MDQHNQLCIAKSVVVISNLADQLITCKNDQDLSAKEYRQTCESLIKIVTDAIALLAHNNSQFTDQSKFALASNLDKTYQQLAKNVPSGSEQNFGDDLPERIQSIKITNNCLKKKKHII